MEVHPRLKEWWKINSFRFCLNFASKVLPFLYLMLVLLENIKDSRLKEWNTLSKQHSWFSACICNKKTNCMKNGNGLTSFLHWNEWKFRGNFIYLYVRFISIFLLSLWIYNLPLCQKVFVLQLMDIIRLYNGRKLICRCYLDYAKQLP